jgi:putative Holliday junction resolvase
MTETGRIAGIDFGERRLGLALSDPLGIMAQPWEMFPYRGEKTFAPLVLKLRARGVVRVVVGLPKHMNGEEGAKAQAARDFGERLAAESGLPVAYMDERLTTLAAQRMLTETQMSGKKKRTVVDSVAAALILQTWMDQQKNRKKA